MLAGALSGRAFAAVTAGTVTATYEKPVRDPFHDKGAHDLTHNDNEEGFEVCADWVSMYLVRDCSIASWMVKGRAGAG